MKVLIRLYSAIILKRVFSILNQLDYKYLKIKKVNYKNLIFIINYLLIEQLLIIKIINNY